MKTTRLLFMMIGCAILMGGVSCAEPSGPASAPPTSGNSANLANDHPRAMNRSPPAEIGKPPPDGKSPDGNQDDRRAAGDRNDGGPTSETGRISQQVLNRHEHSDKTQANGHSAKSVPANSAGVRQPVSIQSVEPATPAHNKTDNIRSLTVPPPSVIQPAGLLLKEAHNHGPATAVIGGPANAKSKTTAAINGTGMNHKP